tara:strand:+ start:3063 stop:3875 length:813 start_codon:yes stop_codon:yes gene_type:complete
MKLQHWLSINRNYFSDTDMRYLLKNIFNLKSSSLMSTDKFLTNKQLASLDTVKKLYIEGMPLAYILGKEDFFGFELKISRDVLIPRKETELIAEEAIRIIKENNLKYILDLCCGSGNIGLSIKKFLDKDIFLTGCDISTKALKIAALNNQIHNAGIKYINSDLLSAFKKQVFDLIVANPPYVESRNIKGSLSYEPKLALEAGSDGLFFIRKILKQAHLYLKDSGFLIMEIGYRHKDPVRELIDSFGNYNTVGWIKDYSQHFRGVVIKKAK